MGEPGGDLDLAQEALGPIAAASSGLQDLDRDRAVVLEVAGEVDGRHAAAADLALDSVATGKRLRQAIGLRHGTRILPDFPTVARG